MNGKDGHSAELTAQTEATPSLSSRSKKLSTTSAIQACFAVQWSPVHNQ
jgi:hypothetical protein